jgi:uncharacterized protein (TIGR02117 family)
VPEQSNPVSTSRTAKIGLFRITGLANGLRAIIGWFSLALGLYAALGWVGSSLPANSAVAASRDGVVLYVESNGVHTGIIVPLANEHADFSAFADPAHARAAPAGATHMLVGWGHAGVYRNTPHWQDLRAVDALSAVFGSRETVLHVTFMTEPSPGEWQRRFVVSPDAYRQIARRITASFARDGGHSPAYGRDDVFYESVGRYSAIVTCNEWTGAILRDAGVPMGRWTPFAGGVMKWLPATSRAMR